MTTGRAEKQTSSKDWIPFIKRVGKTYVQSQMRRWQMREFIKSGKISYSDKFLEYTVSVDGRYFFRETDAHDLGLLKQWKQ